MDIPTIMETWKSIDGKNFYKTADVCQVSYWIKGSCIEKGEFECHIQLGRLKNGQKFRYLGSAFRKDNGIIVEIPQSFEISAKL